MIKESKKKYKINIPYEYYNEYNILKPHGYQAVTNVLTEVHLIGTNQGIGEVIDGLYAWAILSLTIEIDSPIKNLKYVYGKTWYSGNKGPFYRREYEIADENGKILFKAASYSILLNLENRTIYRKRNLPFPSFKETNKQLIEAKPTYKFLSELKKIEEGKVLNSYIDGLGHVNNLKYSEIIYNTFTDKQIKDLNKLKRLELYFQKEMRKNDSFSVYQSKNNEYQIINNKTEQVSFSFLIKGGK